MTESATVAAPPDRFDAHVETLVVGAGACGMVAALAAHEVGQEVLVIEADRLPAGSTALSAGLIPAAGTTHQRQAGIDDDPVQFAHDIQAKAQGENDQELVDLFATHAGSVIDWLTSQHGLQFSLVTDFDYPGHSRRRMHGLPSRSGRELIDALRSACERSDVAILCDRRAVTIFHQGTRVLGVRLRRPDGGTEDLSCDKLILACNGFGGDPGLVTDHMPEIAEALWFGHDGNQGDAVRWGKDLGADLRHLGAYQGHGNVAHPHGILITWAVIMEGGVQVNRMGQRFWNETQGYSEAARAVMAQPDGVAFAIFDTRIAQIARQFEDFKQAEAVEAVRVNDSLDGLAAELGLPPDVLGETIRALPRQGSDRFGRHFDGPPLAPPYVGVKVTGALFHTQGGLRVDAMARVLDRDGIPFPNLFAGGGAACGVSGRGDSGYLSGNGLLSAVVLGWLAGKAPSERELS